MIKKVKPHWVKHLGWSPPIFPRQKIVFLTPYACKALLMTPTATEKIFFCLDKVFHIKYFWLIRFYKSFSKMSFVVQFFVQSARQFCVIFYFRTFIYQGFIKSIYLSLTILLTLLYLISQFPPYKYAFEVVNNFTGQLSEILSRPQFWACADE